MSCGPARGARRAITALIRVIVNPVAGRGRGTALLDRIRTLASRAGADVEVGESAADVTARARRAAEGGVARLLVAGGDGTVHAAAQAIAGTGCALGLLPLGRGNDLAGALGAARDLDAAFARALSARPRSIDVGIAAGRVFTTVAGLGIDGDVVARVDRMNGFLRGPFVYPAAVVAALASFVAPRLRVVHEGGTIEGPFVLAAMANTSRFGAGMRIAPSADPTDGRLDVVVVHDVSRWRLLAVFPRVYAGTHVGHPAVETVRTRRLEISSDRPMRLQADGELLAEVGATPVIVEIRASALRVAC